MRSTNDSDKSLDAGKGAVGYPKGRQTPPVGGDKPAGQPSLGQAIFLAHGRNKGPFEQLQKILRQFNVPFKVAVDEPNLGRPFGIKVREVMHQCNAQS